MTDGRPPQGGAARGPTFGSRLGKLPPKVQWLAEPVSISGSFLLLSRAPGLAQPHNWAALLPSHRDFAQLFLIEAFNTCRLTE